MKELMNILQRDESELMIQLKDPSSLDVHCFEKMEQDDTCLGCVLKDSNKAIITYATNHYVSLKDFLEQVNFKEEDGYLFLIHLFESLIFTSRNKPVLCDLDCIYVSNHGDSFYFLVLPLNVKHWLSQKEQLKKFVDQLIQSFQTQDRFEIIGYMVSLSNSEEFSIPNLVMGLKNLNHLYLPSKRFFRKRKKQFYLSEPIYSQRNEMNSFVHNPLENSIEIHEEKTQLIGTPNRSKAYLTCNHKQYDLVSEHTLIGRSMACDIRILENDVSLKHAKITCENDRYYIQDLKSANGTFLDIKKVQRKMRLKDKMTIRFGSHEFIFHQ